MAPRVHVVDGREISAGSNGCHHEIDKPCAGGDDAHFASVMNEACDADDPDEHRDESNYHIPGFTRFGQRRHRDNCTPGEDEGADGEHNEQHTRPPCCHVPFIHERNFSGALPHASSP